MHDQVEPKRRVACCILRAAWLALALAVPPLGAVAENGPRLPAPVLDETAGERASGRLFLLVDAFGASREFFSTR